MTLNINPGPLPQDGTRVRLEQFLTDFVSGTSITNFGAEDFAGGDITFVTTSTDPPATSARTRATIWFARGEGRLYKWELFPSPTGSSNTTEGAWLSMSDRKDMLVQQVRTVNPGDALTVSHDADVFKMERAADGRYTLLVNATNPTDIVHIVDPVLSALDSSATYAPAVEFGFTAMKVQGNGPFGFLQRSLEGPTYRLSCTDQSGWTNITSRAAITSQSDSDTTDRLLTMFLCPSLTNMIR